MSTQIETCQCKHFSTFKPLHKIHYFVFNSKLTWSLQTAGKGVVTALNVLRDNLVALMMRLLVMLKLAGLAESHSRNTVRHPEATAGIGGSATRALCRLVGCRRSWLIVALGGEKGINRVVRHFTHPFGSASVQIPIINEIFAKG